MRFALVGQQFRHFRSGLQCLGKIGADLLIEALPQRLVLRSINTSRSAFVSVTYQEDFFDAYDMGSANIVQGSLPLKQMAAIFRSQRAQRTIFDLEENATHLVATVICENGLRKVYKVPVTEEEILQATLDKDSLSIAVIGQADNFNRLLSSFQSSLSEITVIALPDIGPGSSSTNNVKIKSYVDPSKAYSEKALYTNLDICAGEVFVDYDNRDNMLRDVTFNLKDFRAMLQLCEAMRANVTLRFDCAGDPLLVGPHLQGDAPDMRYSAELVLATLLESQAAGLDTAARAAGRALPGSGRVRTPSTGLGDNTPWRGVGSRWSPFGPAAAGRTPAAAAVGAAPHDSRQTAGAPASGAGPSRFAPDTARRDLDTAMQQAAVAGDSRSRPGSRAAGVSASAGRQNGDAVQVVRHSGSHRPLPSGQAAVRHSGSERQQMQQQPQHQQHMWPPDAKGADASFAADGLGARAAAAADDEGLDNFASLPPPDENALQSQQRAAESESVSARHGAGSHIPRGAGAAGSMDMQQGQSGAIEYDDDMDDDDAVPGTPPG